MIREDIVVGPFMCNCVILGCEKTREGIVIDPGDEAEEILHIVRRLDLKIKHLVHTHGHLDHIGATAQVKAETGATILLNKGDLPLYESLAKQAAMFGLGVREPAPVDLFLDDGDTISFGEHTMKVIHTPGHSPGSLCFKLDEREELLFSGDTLFQYSIGRTDLWGGSFEKIIASIKDRLLTMPDDVHVFPGHGPDTHIGAERKKNPFLA
ncbi:MAG: MBL fold metallo-hydrolase [Planctomycetes bacterium RBG_16_59_8]|nr:MAG: MBL fold metallo-hydrolase [Planctomycetes bacterium RBG_16_59_8]